MTYIDPPISSSLKGTPGAYWTFDLVQERLIEAMGLWRRSPGGGKWPFAGDAPWHLVRKELFIDHDAGREQAKARPIPLSREQIRERDEASEWIARFVPERDRLLVVLAITQLAHGRAQVRWSEIRKRLSAEISPRGLDKRYRRAIAAIAVGL